MSVETLELTIEEEVSTTDVEITGDVWELYVNTGGVGILAPPVPAEEVQVAGPHGVFDTTTLAAAITQACEQTSVPEEVIPVVIAAIEASIDLDDIPDPATLAQVISNAMEIAAHSIVGTTVLGINLTALSTALAQALFVNSVSPSDPTEPDDPERATWIRTAGDLRSFVDFRFFPDGPIDAIPSNGIGSDDPLTVRSFASLGYPFQPALVDAGAVTSDQVTESTPSDPTPKTGFSLYEGGTPLSPGTEGRIEWGHGGIVVGNGDLEDYIPTNVAISDEDGNAYLMGVVIGRFDTGADTTDPGNSVSARMRLIRDDLTAPTTIASAALPRLPQKGDRFAFTWDADGNLAGHMNGTEIVSVTETTHDISTFDRIGMPLHQGSDAVDWNDGYYTRVEWFGISGGEEITGDTGTHYWTDDGWKPTGPQAFPSYREGTNGVDGVDGNTILYGTAAPTTEGVDGDFYIRTTTNYIYGPKASGTWPSGTSLVGAAGADGGLPRCLQRSAYLWDAASSGSESFTTDTATAQGGGFTTGEGLNDYIEFVDEMKAGTYTLEIWHVKSSSSGEFTITVDGGSALGSAVDCYNSTTTRNHRETRTGIVLTAGTHTLRIAMLGKNASSSGYRSGIQAYAWRRTA